MKFFQYSTLFFTLFFTMINIAHAQQQQQEGSFNCSSITNADAAIQSNQQYGCNLCSSLENLCRVGATYSVGLNCTVQAQACLQFAVSPGTTLGAYDCAAARDTCAYAYLTNESFCASQFSGCETCQEQERACRNATGANQSLCSSEAGTCYAKAITFGYEIAA